jgi:hypothetical protein
MTTKIDPPATDSDKIVDFSKLDAKAKLEAFIEATKAEDFKNIDLYEKLGLDKPVVDDKSSKNKAVIEEELPKFEASRSKLAEAGYKFEKVAMSASEKLIHEKIEKQSSAKFEEQKTDILKIDEDFPVEDISKMSIPTEDKNTVMATLKGVAVRNSAALAKLRTELDTANSQLKEAKLASPENPDKKDQSGESIVSSKLEEFGWTDLNKSPAIIDPAKTD